MSLTIFRNACSREEGAQLVEGAIPGTGVVTTGGGIGEVGTDGDTGLTSGLGGEDVGRRCRRRNRTTGRCRLPYGSALEEIEMFCNELAIDYTLLFLCNYES
jgi:hypothetical protein